MEQPDPSLRLQRYGQEKHQTAIVVGGQSCAQDLSDSDPGK